MRINGNEVFSSIERDSLSFALGNHPMRCVIFLQTVQFQSDFVVLIRIDRPNGTTRRKKRTFNRCFGQHSAITRCDISLIVFSMPFETFIAKLQPCVVHAYFIMCLFIICSVARCVRVQYSYSTVHTVYMQMNPAWPLAIASPSV